MPTVKDIVIKKPDDHQIETCKQWPIWSCEKSTFDWDYTQTEKCLIIEGEVTVTDRPAGQESVTFGPGEFRITANGPGMLGAFGSGPKPRLRGY